MNDKPELDIETLAKPTRTHEARVAESLRWYTEELENMSKALLDILQRHPRTMGEGLDQGFALLDFHDSLTGGDMASERKRLADRLFYAAQSAINGGGDD
jgi:hypothetical protein